MTFVIINCDGSTTEVQMFQGDQIAFSNPDGSPSLVVRNVSGGQVHLDFSRIAAAFSYREPVTYEHERGIVLRD